MKVRAGLVAFAGAVGISSGALAFDGCPSGVPDLVLASPDFTSYAAAFSSVIPDPGGAVTCSFRMPLQNVAKGTIAVYTADYRGARTIQNLESVDVEVTHNGVTDGATIPGFVDEVVSSTFYSNIVASTGDGAIESTVDIDMANATDGGDYFALDSIDYAELGRVTLATDEASIVTHLGASTELLTGADQALEGDNEFGIFGGIGSAMLGGTARYNINEGVSLLGGVSLINQGYGTSESAGVVGSAALRYVEPGTSSFRLFGEGGATLGGLHTTFSDAMPADASTIIGLASVHARGGVVMQPDESNQIVLSASLQESFLGVRGYTLTDGGLFTATIGDQTGRFTKVKATAAWQAQLSPEVDLTATGSVGALLAHDGVVVDVDGVGPVTVAPPSSLFAEYGLRLGWKPTDMTRIDGFIQGSISGDVGSHTQIGAAYHLKF